MSDKMTMRKAYEEGRVRSSAFSYIVAEYGNDQLPEELQEWVKGLNKVKFRELYRRCRKHKVMPEAVLEWLDRKLKDEETAYQKKQTEEKGRPHRTAREKYDHQLKKKFDDIRFFFKTREKIRSGMTLKEAVSKDKTKEKYYNNFRIEYDHIETTDIDAFLKNWLEESL